MTSYQLQSLSKTAALDLTARPQIARRLRLTLACVVLASAAAGCGGGSGGGELTASESRTTFELDPLPESKPEFTVSTILIDEPGKSVEVVGLRPIGTPNLKYLGAVTVWPRDRESLTDADLGFPGEGQKKTHPALGLVIPPEETGYVFPGESKAGPVAVNAGFRLLSGVSGGVFDVEVTYRVDGQERKARSASTFLVCKKPCEGDKYDDVDAWADVVRNELGSRELPTVS